MVEQANQNAEIAVVCRCDFESGIGTMGLAACELLARNFPLCILPTEAHLRNKEFITLSNGRELPVCHNPGIVKASFFCDVLWNGQSDYNYSLLPEQSLKYAWLVYDSDELPPRWTELLNDHFDLVVATSPHLIDVARASRVKTPIACLPIPLDLEPLLAETLPVRDRARVRFGSVAAFHPRKGVLTLVEAFLQVFGGRSDAELVLHSNLAFGDTFEEVIRLAGSAPNIVVTHGSLSNTDKNRLIRSFDVFVNCSRGEGYSIGAREALAYGKSLVLSDVGGHRDLAGRPGVILVPAELSVPARYPEIDNGVFGQQRAVRTEAVATALVEAFNYAQSEQYDQTIYTRRVGAKDFSYSSLSVPFAALFNTDLGKFRQLPNIPSVSRPAEFEQQVRSRLGHRADKLTSQRNQVCPAFDAGFFSIFNAFMSHLVWQQREERCHAVYPDWDVDRLIERLGTKSVLSFCYAQPGDGNLWLKLFEPLFGTTDAEMNDPAFLYRHATVPASQHNTEREPLVTYIHAYELYQTPGFRPWRIQYNRVFRQHVRLRSALQAEVDQFADRNLRRPFIVAAHVRHPSHTVEQPGAAIAREDVYFSKIYEAVTSGGLDPTGADWGVFLATDQERVVHRFRAEFGDRLACYSDVRRTRADEDAAFDALSREQQNSDGHQLQHLVAANRANWSVRMAWEVVRDAYAMAGCHALLHVVSNVSTAVSYMNPDIEMVFCNPS